MTLLGLFGRPVYLAEVSFGTCWRYEWTYDTIQTTCEDKQHPDECHWTWVIAVQRPLDTIGKDYLIVSISRESGEDLR